MSSTAVKVDVNGASEKRTFSFSCGTTIWIGREATCDVVLASDLVSRRHVSVAVIDDAMTVTDSSANGTVVGGSLVYRASATVAIGAPIAIGPYTLCVSLCCSAPVSLSQPTPGDAAPALRRKMHGLLVERLDHRKLAQGSAIGELRRDVRVALQRIVQEEAPELRDDVRHALVSELLDEALGLGPLEPLLADKTVTEIMVVDPETVFVERRGKIERTLTRFTDAESVRAAIERIVTPLGRRIDESCPLVDARLPDGSRVNAIIPPLAVRGPCITIRKFRDQTLVISDLASRGALTPRMGKFLERCVRVRKNVVISGGTGSGKTTLLNALSAVIPESERLVTVEDAAELRLAQTHVVSLESRGPNMEGKGAYTIRDLVKNALRMRPDRILVGECRGGEALDMLQAMNTGHDGSMTTIHANSPDEAVSRLETLCLMSGVDLPVVAVRRQIASSVHVIVQVTRFSDGARRVTSIAEVAGMSDHGDVQVEEVFRFDRTGTTDRGETVGEFRATGYVPSFIDAFITSGEAREGDYL